MDLQRAHRLGPLGVPPPGGIEPSPPSEVEQGAGEPGSPRLLAEYAARSSQHRNPNHLDTLAVALAAQDRFEDAEHTARRALQIARARRQSRLASALETRLALFASGKPFRRQAQRSP